MHLYRVTLAAPLSAARGFYRWATWLILAKSPSAAARRLLRANPHLSFDHTEAVMSIRREKANVIIALTQERVPRRDIPWRLALQTNPEYYTVFHCRRSALGRWTVKE